MKVKMKSKLNRLLILIALLFFVISALFACKSGNSNAQKSVSDQAMDTTSDSYVTIKAILAKQLKRGAAMETSATGYKKEDFMAVAIVANGVLKKSGYKLRTDFADRVKLIFGDKAFDHKNLNALNYRTGCLDKEKLFLLEETGSNKYYYIDFKNELLTEFYPLPLLINYQNEFPGLSKLEDKPGQVYDAVENTRKKNEAWKDWPNLSAARQHNIHQIISRNKYLFNNSKADFAWLKNNDSIFLNRLVTVFGYVKDKTLTNWALDKNLITSGNEKNFGSVLWNQGCDGRINVHKEIFDLIKSETSESNTHYLNSIANYIIYLRDKEKLLSLSAKAEIIAKVAYYTQMIINKNEKKFEQDYYTKFIFSIIQTTQSKALFETEFKKHNYYNLPEFKKLWDEQVEYNGGVGEPM